MLAPSIFVANQVENVQIQYFRTYLQMLHFLHLSSKTTSSKKPESMNNLALYLGKGCLLFHKALQGVDKEFTFVLI